MRRRVLLLALSLAAALALEARPALACKIGAAKPYDAAAGSSDEPPPVEIEQISTSLGSHYGGDGPGDCSHLGKVEITLAGPDGSPLYGSPLDGKFGARITVLAGRLPVALIDLNSWIAPIEGNKIALTIVDDHPSADFTISVRTVNAAGRMGPESSALRGSAESGSTERAGGCSVVPRARPAPLSWLLLAIAPLGLAFWRRRSSRPQSSCRSALISSTAGLPRGV
jgi:hypothetical protein